VRLDPRWLGACIQPAQLSQHNELLTQHNDLMQSLAEKVSENLTTLSTTVSEQITALSRKVAHLKDDLAQSQADVPWHLPNMHSVPIAIASAVQDASLLTRKEPLSRWDNIQHQPKQAILSSQIYTWQNTQSLT
jgi:seryl-tRNA synthetase